MLRVLLQFWPVLIPLLVYALWQFTKRRRAHRKGEDKPGWLDGPWFWTVLCAMAVAAVLFIWWGAGSDPAQGTYVPPHMENGRIVPGHLNP